jgi:hypothetical protein
MELNNKIDILDINTTSCNISGNKDIESTSTEGSKGGITLLLANISMDGLCSYAASRVPACGVQRRYPPPPLIAARCPPLPLIIY